MNKEAMLKVAEAIEQRSIPGLGFDMRSYVQKHPCGTTACLAGWAVAVLGGLKKWEELKPVQVGPNGQGFYWEKARELFDLSEEEADELFLDNSGQASSRQKGVEMLRYAVETGSCVWPKELIEFPEEEV